MQRIDYASSIETYPFMKRKGHQDTKAVDYLAFRLSQMRLIQRLDIAVKDTQIQREATRLQVRV